MIRFIACIAAAALAATPLAAQQSPTLRDVLTANHIPVSAQTPGGLDRRITSFAVHDSSDAFTIAYYAIVPGSAVLDDTMHVAVLTKPTSTWAHAAIARDRPRIGADNAPGYLGAVLGIRRTTRHVYVDTHMNPSAGVVLVLTPDLRPVTTLFGWTLHVLQNDVVLYHRSEVHFAPTHSAELWMYDGHTGRDAVVYPRKPFDAVRRRYIETVRGVYTRLGAAWFQANNHHMNPERFESALLDSVTVSGGGETLAFTMLFGDRETGGANTPALELAVVCRNIRSRSPQCRESELSALRRAHPGWSNNQILRSLLGAPINR